MSTLTNAVPATNVKAGSRALGMLEMANLIEVMGTAICVLVQGQMGIGKSALLGLLGKRPKYKNHRLIYIDCNTKADSGDLFMIKYSDDGKTFVTIPHEELGMHLNVPCIIMIDELGKAPNSVKLSLARLVSERIGGGFKAHAETVMFCTTNLTSEGLGDNIPPHLRNRMTVVEMRGADNLEYIEYGVNIANPPINPLVLQWCKETPQAFHSAEMYDNPEENPLIPHPNAATRDEAKVTLRSLDKASRIIDRRADISALALTASLAGTIGLEATLNLATYVQLADQLPTTDSIKADPLTAIVPTDASATMMVVYRTLATIERDWASQWMTYLQRLPSEAQGVFGNGTRVKGYSRMDKVGQNKDYQAWALKNNHMFSTVR